MLLFYNYLEELEKTFAAVRALFVEKGKYENMTSG